jgi:hypothetical protein
MIFFVYKSQFSDLVHFAWECAKEEFKLEKDLLLKNYTWEERKELYCGFQKVEDTELLKDLCVFDGLKQQTVFEIPNQILSVVKSLYSEWNYFFYAFEINHEFYSVIWSSTA